MEESEDTPFVLRNSDGPLDEVVRMLLLSMIEKAEEYLLKFETDREESIHELRKLGKKIRGVLRLIRPSLSDGDYGAADALARGFAKWFSDVRDAAVLIETCDLVSEKYPDADLSSIRRSLVESYTQLDGSEETKSAAIESMRQLRMLRSVVGQISLAGLASGTLEAGYESVWQRGKEEFHHARETRLPEDCHTWRKRAKYLSFHCELLEKPQAEEFADLGSLLGTHHDLAVFVEAVESSEMTIPSSVKIPEMEAKLENEAFELGAELFSET